MLKRLVRPVFNKTASLLGIPEVQQRLDAVDKAVTQVHDQVNSYTVGQSSLDQLATRKSEEIVSYHLANFRKEFEVRLNEVQMSVMNASKEHAEAIADELREFTYRESSALKRSLDLIRSSRPPESVKTAGSTDAVAKVPVIDDSLYVALEDFFRGSIIEIERRQSKYLPYIKNSVSTEFPLLDLGCGRGEWLTFLKTAELPASGVDSNLAAVKDCTSKGLDVELGNIVDYLDDLPDQSIGAVTMFQVMEHLPFPVLLTVMRSILRVLKPGGVFIGEVPNAETLRVGATTFWIDPTHERPLFPGLLKFLATEIGFSKVDGIYSTPLEQPPALGSSALEEVVMELFNQVNGPGDFAVIATA